MKIRWSRWLKRFLLLAAGIVIAGCAFIESGIVERWVRSLILRELADRTGARVELRNFHLHVWHRRVEMEDLTLHGLEGTAAPPLFHAARVNAAFRILSFLDRQIALNDLLIDQPRLAVHFEKDGRSNFPSPKLRTGHVPWHESLLNLQIGRLELRDGTVLLNDRRIPLAIRGRNFEFQLHWAATPAGAPSYVGQLNWRQVELAERRDLAFRFDLLSKFTLRKDAFELDDLVWKLPHSELDLRAELPSLARADWNLWYRGRLSLEDARTIFHQRLVPDATTDFSGQARYASGQWTSSGHYATREINLPYKWFHARGFETWGDFELAKKLLVVPNLHIRALGGEATGRLEMDVNTLAFRTQTLLRGASLAAAFDAVNNKNFPVDTFHWDARMDVDSVNTWEKGFKHFHTKGTSRWSPPADARPRIYPVSAQIDYDFSLDSGLLTLQPGRISTPHTELDMSGTLGAKDSALELQVRAEHLVEWDDFINDLLGDVKDPRSISGKVQWNGRILGPLAGPTFFGHLHATEARYDTLYWDEIEGQLEYSPDAFHLSNATVKRGQTSAALEVLLQLDRDWSFNPGSQWWLETKLTHAPSSDIQGLFGMSYPVSGFLSGSYRGSGTRQAPVFDADFVFEEINARGFRFDRLAGQLHLAHDEYRITRADLRAGPGRVTGDFDYHPAEQEAEFNLVGSGIPLEKFSALQNPSLPVAGRLEFSLQGHGPVRSPTAQGSLRLVSLQIGPDIQGDFRGEVVSDGQNAHVTMESELGTGRLQGQFDVGLSGQNPISGQLSVHQFEMNAFLVAGLHLKQISGHSSVDGRFTIAGALRQPDLIEIQAEIEKISFIYEFVQLQNREPVRLTYRRNEVRIDQAHIYGSDTDLELSGSARFDRDRPIRFMLSGGVNLKFLGSFVPDLEAQGQADVRVSMEGTMSKPRITGRASVADASAHYSDFPVGLSHVKGEFVFDRSRLLFDRITAEAGGGQLTLNGSVTYGEGPLRYEINATTPQTRVRYPAGMSWLVGGTLQLAGTSDAALLSGRVEVKRILFAQGVDVASFFAAASQTSVGPSSSSPFLRSLTFDVAGHTSPGARIEWTGAQIEIDGDVRLRGTWDRPALLGNIHLLGGEMAFRGNTFKLNRGDLNFSNPFRLDPVLNIEATSRISQYEVTINFSGPASRLSLSYRSDPPLPDTDIIALLALGSTGEESGLRSGSSAGSQNYGATALLSEAISSGLGGRIERLFGISHFRVDPFIAGTATESNAAARVTIEQQLSKDLTITYSTNAATSNQYQLIQVEYSVKRGLSVIFLRDINGTYGGDIKFVKHFK